MGFIGEAFSTQPESRGYSNSEEGGIAREGIALQREMADRAFKQSDEQFAWSKDMAERTAKTTDAVTQQQMRIADANEARSASEWDYYNKKGRPLTDQYFKDAAEYDSAERKDAAAGIDVPKFSAACAGIARRLIASGFLVLPIVAPASGSPRDRQEGSVT